MLRDIFEDCVKGDMDSFGLSLESAQDENQWRLTVTGEIG